MHGVSKISSHENVMLISFTEATPAFMVEVLAALAKDGIVVDMISQTAPAGAHIRFGFTASFQYFDAAIKTISQFKENGPPPMVSGGYCKINLFGEDMVESTGVAARALQALATSKTDVAMITTSDLDISVLIRSEDEDVAIQALTTAFAL